MTAHITPRKILLSLLGVIAVFVMLHGVMVAAQYEFGDPNFLKLRALFDLNREQNIPTLFSTLQLLLASLLCVMVAAEVARSKRGPRAYWVGLALVFAFLACDEFCEWHEHLVGPMRRILHATGALSFAWVVPYGAAVAVFAGCYARFWWRLSPPIRWRFAAAGFAYVGAGIGMEMVGSRLFTIYGWESAQFDLECMIEEGMEMTGVALFVHALALQLSAWGVEIKLVIAPSVGDPLLRDALEGEAGINDQYDGAANPAGREGIAV